MGAEVLVCLGGSGIHRISGSGVGGFEESEIDRFSNWEVASVLSPTTIRCKDMVKVTITNTTK